MGISANEFSVSEEPVVDGSVTDMPDVPFGIG
jgi:hypothetical protein